MFCHHVLEATSHEIGLVRLSIRNNLRVRCTQSAASPHPGGSVSSELRSTLLQLPNDLRASLDLFLSHLVVFFTVKEPPGADSQMYSSLVGIILQSRTWSETTEAKWKPTPSHIPSYLSSSHVLPSSTLPYLPFLKIAHLIPHALPCIPNQYRTLPHCTAQSLTVPYLPSHYLTFRAYHP